MIRVLCTFVLACILCAPMASPVFAQDCASAVTNADKLGYCTYAQYGSSSYREYIKRLVDMCTSNDVRRFNETVEYFIEDAEAEHGVDLSDMKLSCGDVFDAALNHARYSPLAADKARYDPALWGEPAADAPPSDSEIWSAVVIAFREQSGSDCLENMSNTCTFALPIVVPGKEADAAAMSNRMQQNNEALQQFFRENNIDPSESSIGGVPDLMLTIGYEVRATNCKATGESEFDCSFAIDLDCKVTGMMIVNGIDIMGASLSARFCPQYMTGDRSGTFARNSDGTFSFKGSVL